MPSFVFFVILSFFFFFTNGIEIITQLLSFHVKLAASIRIIPNVIAPYAVLYVATFGCYKILSSVSNLFFKDGSLGDLSPSTSLNKLGYFHNGKQYWNGIIYS